MSTPPVLHARWKSRRECDLEDALQGMLALFSPCNDTFALDVPEAIRIRQDRLRLQVLQMAEVRGQQVALTILWRSRLPVA